MIDTKKEQERDELHRAIWAIADELRGAVDKLKAFFEQFFGLGNANFTAEEEKPQAVKYDVTLLTLSMAAEPNVEYGTKEES